MKIGFLVLCLCVLTMSAHAIELSYLENAIWRIAADSDDYVSDFAAQLSGLPIDYRAQASIDDLIGYLKVLLGQSSELGTVYHDDVYHNFVSKFDADSFRYSATVVVDDDHLPPQNVVKTGNEISCDEHATKTVYLFKWSIAKSFFLDTGASPSCAAGTCTFSGLPNGHYVLGYSGADFPSLDQFVNE